MKDDIWRTVEAFYQEGSFVKSLNATFVALIRNKKGAVEVRLQAYQFY